MSPEALHIFRISEFLYKNGIMELRHSDNKEIKMPSILIVDENKPSVVMTSEIIKDHVQGVTVDVVSFGKACLDAVQSKKYDLVVIDFDLPDSDGVTLSKLVRNHFEGPILLTAFDDEVVREAVEAEMFFYSDVCSYIKKPIVATDFVAKLEKFLLKKESIQKRFATDFPMEIFKSSAVKSKKIPTVKGRVMNLSIGGAGIKMGVPLKGKVGDEVSLIFDFKKNAKKQNSKTKENATFTKIKAQLVWLDKTKKKANFEFKGVNEKVLKELEALLRTSIEIE
jgi:CheY-like chemotaxis protein